MKQLGELRVREYMTPQAIVVNDSARLVEAIRLMDDQGISVVPVVDEQGKLVGILSFGDLVEMMHEIQADLGVLHQVREETRDFFIKVLIHQGDSTFVRDVMTSPVKTVSSETNLILAAQMLNDRKFHHLPVVDQDDSTVGIISSSDFVRAIADCGALAVDQ